MITFYKVYWNWTCYKLQKIQLVSYVTTYQVQNYFILTWHSYQNYRVKWHVIFLNFQVKHNNNYHRLLNELLFLIVVLSNKLWASSYNSYIL